MEGWVDLVDLIASQPGVELATFRSRVRRPTAPPRELITLFGNKICFPMYNTVCSTRNSLMLIRYLADSDLYSRSVICVHNHKASLVIHGRLRTFSFELRPEVWGNYRSEAIRSAWSFPARLFCLALCFIRIFRRRLVVGQADSGVNLKAENNRQIQISNQSIDQSINQFIYLVT